MTVSKDSSAPLVVITGITGAQGGSVFEALKASSKPYRFKGITRDASKPAAKALADQGVEMVSVNLSADNKKQIAETFQGADYVFAVTDFWSHTDMQREIAEGKTMVDAAKEAGVKTFIFSGLPSYKKLTNNKYQNVDHFEGKAEIDEYAKSTGGFEFYSVQPAMYMGNFAGGLKPRKQDDAYVFFTPAGFQDANVSLIDAKPDYGLWVQSAIESGKYKNGDSIIAAGDELKGKEVISLLEKKFGKINVAEVPVQVWIDAVKGQMGERVATEFAEMLASHWEFGYYGGADIHKDKSNLARKPTSFAAYVEQTDFGLLSLYINSLRLDRVVAMTVADAHASTSAAVFDDLEAALEDFRQGKFLVVLDDENRENEGDLIIAAERITTEQMAFLIKHSSGFVCAATAGNRLDALQIPMMVTNNTEKHRTAYTVTIDYLKGTTTGISAHDRALSARMLADPTSKAEDFNRPGHLVPLRAVTGGVLSRRGHTEAAVDLCKLTGQQPVGVICELVKDEPTGSMARRDDCYAFAQRYDIKMITIEQIVNWRNAHD